MISFRNGHTSCIEIIPVLTHFLSLPGVHVQSVHMLLIWQSDNALLCICILPSFFFPHMFFTQYGVSVSGWSVAVLWGFYYSRDRRQTAHTSLSRSVCARTCLRGSFSTTRKVALFYTQRTHRPWLSHRENIPSAPPPRTLPFPPSTFSLALSLCITFHQSTPLSHFISSRPVLPVPHTQHPFR